MLSASAEPVCLVIADISGYTSYLAGVELDHAQDILADLISTVVTTLRPTFKLAKLEGDAAFVFAPAEKVDGSLLLDTIERCYFGFRRRRRDVRQATACECNACVRIPDLNLKFVAHHGHGIRQKVAGREELLGLGRHRRPPAAQERRSSRRWHPRVRGVHAGLRRRHGHRPGGAGHAPARRTYEHIGEVRALGPRPRAAVAGGGGTPKARHRRPRGCAPHASSRRAGAAPDPGSSSRRPVAAPPGSTASRTSSRPDRRRPTGGRHGEPLHARHRRRDRGDPRLAPYDYYTTGRRCPVGRSFLDDLRARAHADGHAWSPSGSVCPNRPKDLAMIGVRWRTGVREVIGAAGVQDCSRSRRPRDNECPSRGYVSSSPSCRTPKPDGVFV